MTGNDWASLPVDSAKHQADARRERAPQTNVEYVAGQPVAVSVNLKQIPADETHWREEIQRVTTLNIPDDRRVELSQVRYWGNPQEPMVYCRFTILDRDAAGAAGVDVEALIAATKTERRRKPPKPVGNGRSLVVAWADLQVGKVASRGDTGDLIQRVMEKLALLDTYATEQGCDSAYLVDVGDCVESFENVPSQAFTNDLSFPEQLRVARRLYTEAAMRLAAKHSKVVCVGVPSNHGQWRRGKDLLGRPGDDFGLETLTSVADAFKLNPKAFGHVEFRTPGIWQESLSLDINGTILAVAHGHQANRPEGIPTWWAGQVHGGQPASDADILLTGHFHCARIQPSGRSHHTGRAKWWFQAPTLDNGSDWYRLRHGSDSDPNLLAFVVTGAGWEQYTLL